MTQSQYRCEACGSTFTNRDQWESHNRMEHKQQEFGQEKNRGGKSREGQARGEFREEQRSMGGQFRCESCGTMFDNREKWEEHGRMEHKK